MNNKIWISNKNDQKIINDINYDNIKFFSNMTHDQFIEWIKITKQEDINNIFLETMWIICKILK